MNTQHLDENPNPAKESEVKISIPDLFEQIAKVYKDKIAIKTRETTYTYAQLSKISNQIAWATLDHTNTNDESIALVFSDTAKMAAAMLGALKAGKFFIPLDASFPKERLKYMLADSETNVIISDSKNITIAEEVSFIQTKVLNADILAPRFSTEGPNLTISPQSRSALQYTSGSTGNPKGSISTHATTVLFNSRKPDKGSLKSNDHFGMMYSPSFAAGSASIFMSLLKGASLFAYDIKVDGLAGFADWLKHEEITFLSITPSLFRPFAKLLSTKDKFPKIRRIGFSAETVLKSDIDLYKKHFSDHAILRVSYASSEVGVISSEYFDADSVLPDGLVPVGHPLPGKTVVLWDENGEEVSEGEVGEIIIGGPTVHPKYWRSSEEAEKTFLPNPNGDPGMLYQSGDLGKFLPDGRLVHMGRKGFMFKIRGYRVEIAEVESNLLEQGYIRNAAVDGRQDSNGNMRLVAYLELAKGTKLDVEKLRAALSIKLSDYMVPSHFLVLDELPRTPTGKVDYRALPNPEPGRPNLGKPYVAPSTEIESKLAAVWEHVLEIKPVGVEDNFFSLGGDSLLAAQLFVEIERTFHKKLPLSILYQAANVREQAKILQSEDINEEWSPLVKVRTTGSNPPLFCFPGKGGNPIRFRHLAERLGEEQPLYMLQSRGLDGKTTPYENMEAIASDFLCAMQEVQPKGPYQLIGSSFGGKVAYEIAQQLLAKGEEISMLAFVDSYGPGYPNRLPSTTGVIANTYKLIQYLGKHIDNLRVAPWKGKLAYLGHYAKDGLRRLKMIPSAAKERIKEMRQPKIPKEFAEVEKANLRAAHIYQPQPYPGTVTLYRAEQQPLGINPDPTLGWGTVGIENLVIHEVPGHHGSILFEPRVEKMAEIVSNYLDDINTN